MVGVFDMKDRFLFNGKKIAVSDLQPVLERIALAFQKLERGLHPIDEEKIGKPVFARGVGGGDAEILSAGALVFFKGRERRQRR